MEEKGEIKEKREKPVEHSDEIYTEEKKKKRKTGGTCRYTKINIRRKIKEESGEK